MVLVVDSGFRKIVSYGESDPLIAGRGSWNTYEEEFKRVLRELALDGSSHVIFRDIFLDRHKMWAERICSDFKPRGRYVEVGAYGFRWTVSRALGGDWANMERPGQRVLVYYCRSLIRELDLQTQCSTAVERWLEE